MRQNPSFTLASDDGVKRLLRENPWVTIVSMTDAAGLVASHYPVLLDETGRRHRAAHATSAAPTSVVHELGAHELLVIVQGPHGYISPGWYDAQARRADLELRRRPPARHARDPLATRRTSGCSKPLVDHFEDAHAGAPAHATAPPPNAEYAAPDRAAPSVSGSPARGSSPSTRSARTSPAESRRAHHRRARDGADRTPNPALAAEMRRARRGDAAPRADRAAAAGAGMPLSRDPRRRHGCPEPTSSSTCSSRGRIVAMAPTGSAEAARPRPCRSTAASSCPASGTARALRAVGQASRRSTSPGLARRGRLGAADRARCVGGAARRPRRARVSASASATASGPTRPTRALLDAVVGRGAPWSSSRATCTPAG